MRAESLISGDTGWSTGEYRDGMRRDGTQAGHRRRHDYKQLSRRQLKKCSLELDKTGLVLRGPKRTQIFNSI